MPRYHLMTNGSSMEPDFPTGTMMEFIPFKDYRRKIEVGDILLVKDKKKNLIAHRVIHATNNGYILKGDNNHYIDGEYSQEKIVGIYNGNNYAKPEYQTMEKKDELRREKVIYCLHSKTVLDQLDPCLLQLLVVQVSNDDWSQDGIHIAIDSTSGTSLAHTFCQEAQIDLRTTTLYIHLDIDELDANKCSKYDYTCCLGSWEIESDLDINEKIMFINGVLHAVF